MKIGVTGQIGTGKTLVAKQMAEKLNYELIEMDQIVHEIHEQLNVQNKIKETFNLVGDYKKELAQIVFNDSNKLSELEAIIFPEITKKLEDLQDNYVLDSAVLHKNDFANFVDTVVIVTADQFLQIERITNRDHRERFLIEQIIQNQPTIYSFNKPTYVINNSGNFDELNAKIIKICKII